MADLLGKKINTSHTKNSIKDAGNKERPVHSMIRKVETSVSTDVAPLLTK